MRQQPIEACRGSPWQVITEGMFLKVNLVSNGRFIPMGTELEPQEVPPEARPYECSAEEAAELREMLSHARERGRGRLRQAVIE
jgi:hypothetical protein